MVGLGLLMILVGLTGVYLHRRSRLYDSRPFQRFVLMMGPSGVVSLLAGWFTTEIGRQPWVIYGVMRTSDGLSSVSAQQVGISLMIFVMSYFVVFGVGIYYLLKLMIKGPHHVETYEIEAAEESGPGHFRTPMRPLSGADDELDDSMGERSL